MLSRRPLLFAACALWSVANAIGAGAQPAPASITHIRQRYDLIQTSLPKLREVKMTADEGADAEAIAYYDGSRLRKVLARGLYGGAPSQQYYFWDNRLIFVLDSRPPETRLDQPAQKNRFYFNNGKLIRWIDGAGNPVQVGSKFRQYEKEFRRTGEYWLRVTRGRDFRRLEVSRGVVDVFVP